MKSANYRTMPASVALVTKSNAFIRAHVNTDSKVFYHILNILASKIRPNDKDFKIYEIPVRDILKSSPDGGVGGKRYKKAAEIIDKVMTTRLYLPKEDQELSIYTLFSKLVLNEKNNYIAVGIHPDLKPHFLELREHYTQMKLNDLLTISSKYSIRLFEILMSWHNMPAYQAPLAELHNMLGTPVSMRKDFRQFRLRILEPGKHDIYEKAQFYFDWEPIKVGRRVEFIKFTFNQPALDEQNKTAAARLGVLQKESNMCFEKHQELGKDCKPKKRSDTCRYCLERGRRYMKLFNAPGADDAAGFDELVTHKANLNNMS